MATSPPLLPEPVPSSGLAVMEEDTGEETARMKELEEMVKKLKIENEQLLNQVTKADENVVSSSLPNGNAANDTNGRVTTPTKSSQVDDNDDILETISDREVDEDTWLYMSPLRPPTKEHRKISPSQWLSEGKMRQRGQYRERSFQDIKKSLAYAMSETEAEKPPSKSLVSKGRASPTNKTAQKYLNDVRQRRSSQSESDDSATERGGPPSPSRSPAGTNQAHTFTRKPRNVPVRPVIPGQAPPRKARVPPSIENDELSTLKVKKWDPSKIQHNSDEEDEEEEIVQPAKRWQVKQVPNNDGVPIVNKWKVKQVPETGPGEEGQDATQEKERKWKVKQVPDSTIPAKEEREEEEEEIPNLRRKWKVKQVPDRHDNEEEEEEEEEVPLQRKWKVKQVHNVEGGGEAVPQQRKWKVKQVHDNQEEEEEEVQPQKIWKVKQVPDHHGNKEEEEEEELPQKKWAVKQVPETGNDMRETTPTQEAKRKGTYTLEDEEVGVADEEEGEGLHPKLERKGTYTAVPDTGEAGGEGEGGEGEEGEGDDEKKQATVKRSGTFTKDKPKVYTRRPDNECGRDSSASDRTMSPVEAENLKIKWTPRNPSPASGDEGKRTRTQSPASPRGSPDQQIRGSRYSDYQAQIRQQPSVGGGRGHLRSPVARQGLPSPLRQQRQAEGGVASSPYVSPNKQVTPRLRPPSPRRSSQLPSNGEETTPTRVTTNQTTPTSHTPRATSNQTTPTGQTPRSVGPSPRGGKVKGTSPGGIKLAKPLTTSPQAPPQGRVSQSAQQPQRRRVLPAAQSTKGMSPRGGAKASKPQRGGGEGRTRTGTRPSPSPKQDDSWLDECF